MGKIEKGKILSLENVFMTLNEKVQKLEEKFENSMKYDQKKIFKFEEQLKTLEKHNESQNIAAQRNYCSLNKKIIILEKQMKAFGIEMDRIEKKFDNRIDELRSWK